MNSSFHSAVVIVLAGLVAPCVCIACADQGTTLTVTEAANELAEGRRLSVIGCLRLGEFTALYSSAEDAAWSRAERGIGLNIGASAFPHRGPLRIRNSEVDLERLPAEATVIGEVKVMEGRKVIEVDEIRTQYMPCRSAY